MILLRVKLTSIQKAIQAGWLTHTYRQVKTYIYILQFSHKELFISECHVISEFALEILCSVSKSGHFILG